MNNTTDNGQEPELAYALVFGSILVIGLPLNAFSLWTLLRHHSLKSPSAIYMVNLAISDLLLVISLPMRVYFYATGTWPLGKEACIGITMLFLDNIRSSAIFITLISVDRLLAVVYPLRSRHLRTVCNTWKAVVLVWLFVGVLNITERVYLSTILKSFDGASCFEFPHHRTRRSPMAYVESALGLTLLAVNIVCTTSVSWTLHKHLSDFARVNSKVNVMLLFVMSLVIFVVCFLPPSIALLVMGRPLTTPYICVASANCCMDPLLYYFSLDAFWKKKEDADLAMEP
ncbi:lysophosphatidic acid receptor 6-like [Epinephelus fuscoguttatus]|uniref:lysophosphatidic acid receptor 6-like n=1 Tax=Epinephelus fuscoguttatus TaxID=293821 RepID=UPI0020D0BCF5|nr:lysophosphatidic acid receptor 6-like [Epinephelus fuscoguttatus]